MAILLIAGNTNQHTFANAIVAVRHLANEPLKQILVLHSPESHSSLASSTAWHKHLKIHDVSPSAIISFVVDLEENGEPLAKTSHHLEALVTGVDRRETIFIDLTNGSSLYKNLLAIVGYILGVDHQFALDTSCLLRKLKKEEPKELSFIDPLSSITCYHKLPSHETLDNISMARLTEVRRFGTRFIEAAQLLARVAGANKAQEEGFLLEASGAAVAFFRGLRHCDPIEISSATRTCGRAFEEFVNLVYSTSKNTRESNQQKLSLSRKITDLEVTLGLESVGSKIDLYRLLGNGLKNLRNVAAHEQSTTPELEAIKGRIAMELLLGFIDFVGILAAPKSADNRTKSSPRSLLQIHTVEDGRLEGDCYFGLDGDDTGRRLEELFSGGAHDKQFTDFSESIWKAMTEIQKIVKQEPIKGKVLFCAGDDILFKGKYSAAALRRVRDTYYRNTSGLTCSIGYGRNSREAYVALKMAKAKPGKNAIVGIEEMAQPT